MKFVSTPHNRPFNMSLVTLCVLCLLFAVIAPTVRHTAQRESLRSSANSAETAIARKITSPLTPAQAREAYGRIALSFEANRGQMDESVNFLARGAGYTLFLKPTEAVFVLAHKSDRQVQPESRKAELTDESAGVIARALDASGASSSEPPAVLRMKLVGSNERAAAEGSDELPGKVNYFNGNDSSRWLTGIQTFGRVSYGEVYPGIDVVYYGNQRQLEYDFRVAPGRDAEAVKLEFEGADKVEVNAAGDLLLTLGESTIRQPKPLLYQEVAGVRRVVDGGYEVGPDNRVGFQVGEYDAQQTLVIDPVLAYSTYLGGSGTDDGNDITIDAAGNAYICGQTDSTNFPTANAIQATFGGKIDDLVARDGFVTKLNAAGTAFVYSTYIGGNKDDKCNKIAVDASGNAYVAGETSSLNFPTANAIQATFGGGLSDAFIAKINAAGSAFVYSTYLGGEIFDAAHALTIDSTGSVYATGRTTSSNFPTVNPIQATYSGGPGADAFVTKINAAGTALVYSTYLGGNAGTEGGFTAGFSIKVDSTGNAYVTGQTRATNFPTANAIQATFGGGFPDGDAFVTKFNAAGSALVYSTYLGGSDNDIGFEITVDSLGSAHVAGVTHSANFPTGNAFQATRKGASDAFVTKLNAAGTAFVYSTYLGGTADDSGNAIALDSSGNTYVAGGTSSTDFPLMNPIQNTMSGVFDVFVTKLNSGGTALTYSTYLGGSGGDTALAIAVNNTGVAYLTGRTASTNFPTLTPLQSANAGGQDAFVFKLDDPPPPATSTIQIQQATYNVTEDMTFVPVKVTRTGNTTTPANVDYATADATALQRTDYTIALGTLRFAAGETEKTINILVNEDSYVEGLETFTLALSNPTGNASLGAVPVATLRIADDATEPSTNVIDDTQIFVGQHYHDFLNRQADAGGLAYWSNEITKCGSDQSCINSRRIGVSAAFFIEMEFQDRGAVIHYLYRAGVGRRPMFLEFTRDRSYITAGGNLAADLLALATDFVQRAEFTNKYAPALTRDQFVDALLLNVQQTSNVNLTSRRNELLAEYDAGTGQAQSRARVLLKLISYTEYKQAEYNRAFVLSQYFAYLRRDPDEGGFQFWLNILNNVVPNNYRALVCAFITSAEYQTRFGAVVSHQNSECASEL